MTNHNRPFMTRRGQSVQLYTLYVTFAGFEVDYLLSIYFIFVIIHARYMKKWVWRKMSLNQLMCRTSYSIRPRKNDILKDDFWAKYVVRVWTGC